MSDYLGLVTVVIASFALAAALLWLTERRRRGEPVPTTEVVIRAGGKTVSVAHLSLETLASRLRAHPEILSGDFEALSVARGEG